MVDVAHCCTHHSVASTCRKFTVPTWSICVQVWEDMREAGVEPNSYVYVALINACERSSDWRRALRVFDTMKVCRFPVIACSIDLYSCG